MTRTEDSTTDQSIAWYLLLFLLFLVLLAMAELASAEPINLTGGEVYHYSYTNLTNETVSQEFSCAANLTACMTTNMNLSLSPGEYRVVVQDQCAVTATCGTTAVTVVNATCEIDKDVRAGDTYKNNDGACRVDLHCQENDKCERLTSTVAYTKHYKLTTDGENINFEFDGKNQPFSRNSTSFTYEADITYECPVEVTKETFEGVDLLNLCKETNPYLLTWVDLAIKRGYDCQDQHAACQEQVSSAETQCTNRVGALNDRILGLTNQLNNTDVAFNSCLQEKQDVESREWFFISGITMLGLWAGGSTILCLVLGLILWKNRKGKGDDE